MTLPFAPPLAPMLSTAAEDLPGGEGWLFEPKWDGFRTLVFRDGDELLLQSRDEKPMNRYFPELVAPLAAALPERCVLDGEIVIVGPAGLDFEALLLRIHPGRVPRQAARLADAGVLRRLGPARGRRRGPARHAAGGTACEARDASRAAHRRPIHLSPATRDRALAEDWFRRFEGAGLDGVMAKRLDEPYRPGERTMVKVKHRRTADCVVAGFRWHKNGRGTMVGSLLLGLYDDDGTLQHVGVAAAFTTAMREAARRGAGAAARERARESSLARLGGRAGRGSREGTAPARRDEPLEPRARTSPGSRSGPSASARSRTTTCRGRASATRRTSVRWRPDKPPEDCRYDQLEVTPAYELERVFGASSSAASPAAPSRKPRQGS